MTQPQFVLRNALRNRRRTFLTAASVALSVFLLALFGATYRYLQSPPEIDRTHLVLVVMARTAVTNPLPVRYTQEIQQLPGVVVVSPVFWVDARYGPQEDTIPAIACDAEKIFQIASDWKIPDAQLRSFEAQPNALAAGRKLIEKYGWKIGDRIHLSSPNFLSVPLELEVRGVFTSTGDEGMLAFHWSYLNEALGRPNLASYFYVLADSPESAPRLMTAIDEHFRNAPRETRTQTIKQFLQGFLGWLGNVKQILLIVMGAVVFAVLLVVANTMAMSIRERTTEIALLRALGFSSRRILLMLATEAMTIALAGSVVGCAFADIACRYAADYRIGGAVPAELRLDSVLLTATLAAALGIALASTVLPALRAARVNIAQALRFVG